MIQHYYNLMEKNSEARVNDFLNFILIEKTFPDDSQFNPVRRTSIPTDVFPETLVARDVVCKGFHGLMTRGSAQVSLSWAY